MYEYRRITETLLKDICLLYFNNHLAKQLTPIKKNQSGHLKIIGFFKPSVPERHVEFSCVHHFSCSPFLLLNRSFLGL